MRQAHYAQPVVVLGVQGKIAHDGDAHTDGDIPLDHLRVVHFQHHIVAGAALPQLLLHLAAAQAFRAVQNQGEARHFRHGHRMGMAMQQLVARRRNQHHIVVEQFRKLQGAVIVGRRRAQRQVNFPGFYQLDEIGVGARHQSHPNFGEAGPELADGAGQVVRDDVGVGAHHEGAAAFGVVHLRFEGVDGFHDGRNQFVEHRALGGELDGAFDAVKQDDAEFPFQLPQVGGYGGLAQFQLARRFGDAPQARHVVKADDFPQFHCHSPFRFAGAICAPRPMRGIYYIKKADNAIDGPAVAFSASHFQQGPEPSFATSISKANKDGATPRGSSASYPSALPRRGAGRRILFPWPRRPPGEGRPVAPFGAAIGGGAAGGYGEQVRGAAVHAGDGVFGVALGCRPD